MNAAAKPPAVTIRVRVQARGSRNEIQGFADGCLRIKTTAPPTDGRANKDVARQLASAYEVPPSHVKLLRGATGREKVFRITGPYTAPDCVRAERPRIRAGRR